MDAYLPSYHRVASALAATTDRSMWVRRSHIGRDETAHCLSSTGTRRHNPYGERFNRSMRYDWLGPPVFALIEEARKQATTLLWIPNHERPTSAWGHHPVTAVSLCRMISPSGNR